MFSKACQYGIKASVYIAQESSKGNRTNLKDIAHNIDTPVAFTAKILHQLAKSNILSSLKGPTGGFVIEEGRAKTIFLSDIVSAIDGDAIFRSEEHTSELQSRPHLVCRLLLEKKKKKKKKELQKKKKKQEIKNKDK